MKPVHRPTCYYTNKHVASKSCNNSTCTSKDLFAIEVIKWHERIPTVMRTNAHIVNLVAPRFLLSDTCSLHLPDVHLECKLTNAKLNTNEGETNYAAPSWRNLQDELVCTWRRGVGRKILGFRSPTRSLIHLIRFKRLWGLDAFECYIIQKSQFKPLHFRLVFCTPLYIAANIPTA